ncbi:uncharacterized protein FFE2_16035 [Fusarium fujikuroi]|nr:uncharacterized protein FFE2_16035 [Fusarium fujikuroi]
MANLIRELRDSAISVFYKPSIYAILIKTINIETISPPRELITLNLRYITVISLT